MCHGTSVLIMVQISWPIHFEHVAVATEHFCTMQVLEIGVTVAARLLIVIEVQEQLCATAHI